MCNEIPTKMHVKTKEKKKKEEKKGELIL